MDFMAKLYAEEQEKTAGAEVERLFDQMSIPQLEQVLGIEKKAGPEHSVRPESWYDGQRGIVRATRAGDSGLGLLLADSALIKERVKKSLIHALVGGGIGAAGGALVGGVARGRPGLGAAIGGMLGAGVGDAHGMYSADKAHLAKSGIEPTLLGLGRGRYTPEAAQKYLGSDPQKELEE